MSSTALHQIASTAPLLLFGLLALRVWRRLEPRRDRAALAWGLTAGSFLIVGTYATAHAVFSAWAIAGGEGSWLYGFVSRWALPASVGRDVASAAYAAMLLGLMALDRRAGLRITAAAPAVLLAAAVAGTVVAGALIPFDDVHTHATVMAVLCAATAIPLMAALVAAVLNDGLDQLLWLAVTVYTLKQTVTVSLLAIMAWWAVAPQPGALRMLYWMGMILPTTMALLAARRLQLAARGRRVPGLYERLEALRRPAPTERPL